MRVPRFTDQGPVSTPAQSFRVVPGGDARPQQLQQLGQGLQSAGAGIFGVGSELEQQANSAAIESADNEVADAVHALLEDPESGYLHLQGKEALDARKGVDEKIERVRSEARRRLSKAQQTQFDRLWVARKQRTQRVLDRHTAEATSAYRLSEGGTRADRFARDLEGAWAAGDIEAAEVARGALLDQVDELGKVQGFGPEQAAELRRQTLQKAHVGIVGRLLQDGSEDVADGYLRRYADEIDGGTLGKLRDAVKSANLADRSTSASLSLLEKFGVEPGTNRPARPEAFMLQATAELNRQYLAGRIGAELRDATLRRVNQDQARLREGWATQTRDMMQSAIETLRDNPMMDPGALPADLQAELKSRGAWEDIVRFSEDGRYHTHPQILETVMRQTPAQWRQYSQAEVFTTLRGHLSNRDLYRALSMHAAAQGNADDVQKTWLSRSQRVDRMARQIGLLPADANREQRAAFEDWEVDVLKPAVAKRQRALGRALTEDEFDAELSRLASDLLLKDDSSLFGLIPGVKQVPLIAAGEDEAGELFVMVGDRQVFLRDVPEAAQQAISTRYQKKHGRRPTTAEIVEVFAVEQQRVQAQQPAAAQPVGPGYGETLRTQRQWFRQLQLELGRPPTAEEMRERMEGGR